MSAKPLTLILFVLIVIGVESSRLSAQQHPKQPAVSAPVCITANGEKLPSPDSKQTYRLSDGAKSLDVPIGMVYIPSGEFNFGAGKDSKKVYLDAYFIGKYSVTNAEFKVFVDATNGRAPSYWKNAMYPEGKGNHPVAFVSMTQAKAYADWLSKETGLKYALPTSEQWEHAARGPKNTVYPWGDTNDVSFSGGTLKTKYNFNAVLAAEYLTKYPERETSYVSKSDKYGGQKTTVSKITAYKDDGTGTQLVISGTGQVRGWVAHSTNTGFIGTELFREISNSGGNTTPVGFYEEGKSGYGCYDMAGNIWNWCDTKITATNGAEKGKLVYEIRGGSWYATSGSCKSVSIGEGRAPTGAYNTVGFRVVVNLGESQ